MLIGVAHVLWQWVSRRLPEARRDALLIQTSTAMLMFYFALAGLKSWFFRFNGAASPSGGWEIEDSDLSIGMMEPLPGDVAAEAGTEVGADETAPQWAMVDYVSYFAVGGMQAVYRAQDQNFTRNPCNTAFPTPQMN